MELIKKHFGLLFVLLFAVVASFPLFNQGFYPMHDNEQIARLYDLNSALNQGQFPPRISPNLGFGYGYPFFNFYPSFAYYVGEIFVVLGFGYIVATKLMLFTGFLLAAFFSYLLARDLFGEEAGVVAAAFYTFAPYHAVDIYVRGAYAEFFSFVFLPLILWTLYKFAGSLRKTYAVLFAIGICFLILSHNLIFIMFLPFVLVWIAYLYFQTKDRKDFLVWAILGLILGFCASAYFSLPSYLERDFTLIRILTSELANYNLHFICVHQLWNSAWGYGGSIPSCRDGLTFEVGKIALLTSAIALVLFVYASYKNSRDKNLLILPLLSIFLVASMFLTVKQSKFIWDSLTPLWYVHFPWRFLTLCVLFSSILSGSVVYFFKNPKKRITAMLVLIIAIIFFNISIFKPERIINVSDIDYTNSKTIRWDTSSLAYEYVPANIATKKSIENTTKIDITEDQIKSSPYKIVKGVMIVSVKKDLPQEKTFDVYALTKGVLRINTFAFPGWQVYINGRKASYTSNNKLVLIDVKVPFGKNTVRAVFEDTPVRKLGNMISIVSIIVICLIAVAAVRKKNDLSSST